jgi:hypothetical protein
VAPSAPSFMGWISNFVGSESGQIQSVKLLQNNYSHREGGGELNREKGRRATGESIDYKAGLKIPTSLNVRQKLAISSL